MSTVFARYINSLFKIKNEKSSQESQAHYYFLPKPIFIPVWSFQDY